MVSAVGRGGCTYPVLSLAADEMEEFADLIRKVKSEHNRFIKEDFLHWYSLPKALENYIQKRGDGANKLQRTMLPCGAAKTQCAITADGWVVPCNKFHDYHCGNLREESFISIWNNSRMEQIRGLAQKATSDAHGCNDCRYNPVCTGGCRAEAFLHYGDIEAPDPSCAVLPDSAVHTYSKQPVLINITSSKTRASV